MDNSETDTKYHISQAKCHVCHHHHDQDEINQDFECSEILVKFNIIMYQLNQIYARMSIYVGCDGRNAWVGFVTIT